jgi:hypothetical protein
MSTTRTKPVITLAILLAVLALVSIASLVTTQLLGGVFGGARVRGNFTGTPGPNGTFRGGNNGGGFQGGNGGDGGGFQGGNGGTGGFRGGNGGGGGNFQGRGGAGGGVFALFGAARSMGINPLVFFWIGLGINIIGIVLVLLCAFGVWKQKKVALNWAMVLGILFLLPAVFGLFGFGRFNIRLIFDVLTVLAGVAILVMGVLPSVRENFE